METWKLVWFFVNNLGTIVGGQMQCSIRLVYVAVDILWLPISSSLCYVELFYARVLQNIYVRFRWQKLVCIGKHFCKVNLHCK